MRSTTALNFGAFALSGSFMVVFPLLPDLQERAHMSTSQLGWVAAAGFVAALAAQLFIAPHADRGRERLVIGGAVITMALSTLVYAFGTSVNWFIAGRLGAGLAYGAFVPAALGLLVRHVDEGRGQRIGRLHSLELAGMAVGPMFAVIGKMAIGVELTLVAASVLTIAFGFPVLTMKFESPESPAGAMTSSVGAGHGTGHESFLSGLGLLRHRAVVASALVITAYMIPVGAYDALFPRYLTDLGAPDWLLGLALMAFAVPSVLLANWAGRYVDRVGPFSAAARGGAANIAVIVAYGMVRVPMVVVAIGLFESGGQTIVGAAGAAAMGWAAPGRRAATAQGLGEATGTVAATLVAALAAPLYAAGGAPALFFVTAALTGAALSGGVRMARTAVPVEADTAAVYPGSGPMPSRRSRRNRPRSMVGVASLACNSPISASSPSHSKVLHTTRS
jgi:predicted MFS family arabinose efflux permease